VLGTAVDASLVYALLHVNLSAMSKLGGVSSPRFWLALTAGVAAAFVTESMLLLSGIYYLRFSRIFFFAALSSA